MSRYRSFVFALLALGLPLAPPSHAATADAKPATIPDVRSQSYYIFDGRESSVLASRGENTPAPIASITKLMTALVVLEAGQPMDEKVAITAADVRGTV